MRQICNYDKINSFFGNWTLFPMYKGLSSGKIGRKNEKSKLNIAHFCYFGGKKLDIGRRNGRRMGLSGLECLIMGRCNGRSIRRSYQQVYQQAFYVA